MSVGLIKYGCFIYRFDSFHLWKELRIPVKSNTTETTRFWTKISRYLKHCHCYSHQKLFFSEEDYDAFCLAYMFTYRDFEMGTLGLAWTGDLKNAGGVCEKNGVNIS